MKKRAVRSTIPHAPMNQWVRDALDHANMSDPEAAVKMTGTGLGTFDKSTIQKMTASRGVSLDEAEALSKITGYPLPLADLDAAFAKRYAALPADKRAVVDGLVALLEQESGSKDQ